MAPQISLSLSGPQATRRFSEHNPVYSEVFKEVVFGPGKKTKKNNYKT